MDIPCPKTFAHDGVLRLRHRLSCLYQRFEGVLHNENPKHNEWSNKDTKQHSTQNKSSKQDFKQLFVCLASPWPFRLGSTWCCARMGWTKGHRHVKAWFLTLSGRYKCNGERDSWGVSLQTFLVDFTLHPQTSHGQTLSSWIAQS